MKNANEGVMYPVNAASLIKNCSSVCKNIESTIIVPHKAWILCKNELDSIFSSIELSDNKIKNIFVLAPLHKGQIIGEPLTLYTPCNGTLKGSNWTIPLSTPEEILTLDFVRQNDDICTEEHSLEILAPYFAILYPNVPVTYILAPKEIDKKNIQKILEIIGRFSSHSLIFISNNKETHCASMWIL